MTAAELRWPGTDEPVAAPADRDAPSSRRAAPGASRGNIVAGAAPGGWVGRPAAADPADETRLDDPTDPDLAGGAGGTRSRRRGAEDAPAKRGRRDQKAPKVKAKRKTRGRDQDSGLPGDGEIAAATQAGPGSGPAALAADGETAAATRAGPSAPPVGWAADGETAAFAWAEPGRPADLAVAPATTGPSRTEPGSRGRPPGPGDEQPAARRRGTPDPDAGVAPQRPGRSRAGRQTSRRRARRVYAAVGGVVVIAGAAVAFELLQGSGPSGPVHQIVTPQAIGSYVQAPALAASMKAAQVRRSIVTQSNGEASNVVAAVYESSASQPGPSGSASPAPNSTGPGAGSAATDQIVLFIGGNLSGTSAKSFITSFIGKLPGAVITAAGPLGGEAACVPGTGGNPAECAWADNDTFGLVASPTLSSQALASELRLMRPQVEHRRHLR
jgi:hypothetical protein